jgi:hypothetical protein
MWYKSDNPGDEKPYDSADIITLTPNQFKSMTGEEFTLVDVEIGDIVSPGHLSSITLQSNKGKMLKYTLTFEIEGRWEGGGIAVEVTS